MRYFLLALACIILISLNAFGMEKPIVYYSFDNIKGDIVPDLSGFGNDGTMQNNPKIIDGKMGKALEFSSSRVAINASTSLGTEMFKEGIFTLVLWIKAARKGNEWQQIFRAGPDPNDTLFINNDGRLSWRGWVGGAWAGGMCETAAGVVDADTWTHVAVTSDAKNFRVYVKGEVSKESNFQATRGNNKEYMIGGYAGGESYTGAVDEFALFKATLKEADIIAIMNKGVQSAIAVDHKNKLPFVWSALKIK